MLFKKSLSITSFFTFAVQRSLWLHKKNQEFIHCLCLSAVPLRNICTASDTKLMTICGVCLLHFFFLQNHQFIYLLYNKSGTWLEAPPWVLGRSIQLQSGNCSSLFPGEHTRLLSEPDSGVEVSVADTGGQVDGTLLQSPVSGMITRSRRITVHVQHWCN